MSEILDVTPNQKLSFRKHIDIEYALPEIILANMNLQNFSSEIDRVALCTSQRNFALAVNWDIFVDLIEYNPNLNGTIIIPTEVDDETVIFSGANIPAPWIFSTISMGILQPMGPLLTASIIHEFLYKYGFVLVQESEEELKEVAVSRNHADRLFKDVVTCSTGSKFIGYLAYFAATTGWIFGKKYNGSRFNGTPPVLNIIVLAAIIYIIFFAIANEGFGPLAAMVLFIYLTFYIASIVFSISRKTL